MSVLVIATLGCIGICVGVLIGCIGVGGVLLVPSLTYIGGLPIHVAIASTMASYLCSGLVGAVAFARYGSIRWSQAGYLCAGAMPGAFIGAAAVHAVPASYLELIVGVLVIGAAADLLRDRPAGDDPAAAIAPPALAVIGLVAGIGSAMSGTGGPLILIPILLWLRTPVLAAVGLSQVIQLPIAAFATVGNLTYGALDAVVAGAIALLLMIGVAGGAHLAHRVPARVMKRVVSVALLSVGVLIFSRLAMQGFE